MIAVRAGTSSSVSRWSEREDLLPVERDARAAPAATSRWRGSARRRSAPSRPTRGRGGRRRRRSSPVPGTTVTLRPFSSDSRPLVSRSTTCCLRAWLVGRSSVGWPASTPNSLAPRTVRRTSAVWRSSLAGMQPRCRQVPPTRASSIMAIRRARRRRRRAPAAYPPGPPPRTTTSNLSATVLTTFGSRNRLDVHCAHTARWRSVHQIGSLTASGHEDLDRAGRQDRQPGHQGQQHQRARLHAPIFAACGERDSPGSAAARRGKFLPGRAPRRTRKPAQTAAMLMRRSVRGSGCASERVGGPATIVEEGSGVRP